MKLSILIPSTHDREYLLGNLLSILKDQIEECDAIKEVVIITDIDNREMSIGMKRQRLIEAAIGEYIVFIDSDDEVSNDYISEILKAIDNNPDVVSFDGFMTTNNENKEAFKIGKDLPYITMTDAYGKKEYLRFNNHLSPMKREIALQIGYKDLRFAEDHDFAFRLKNSGLIKTEYKINKELYHYKYIKNK